MADVYENFEELAAVEIKGVDYQINTLDNKSDTIIIAIHGGGIERGSGELAQKLSTICNCNYYEFEGIKTAGNYGMHITSTNFDEPTALTMVAESYYLISCHGVAGTELFTYIGGLDFALATKFQRELEKAGFILGETPEYLDASSLENITNKNTRSKGVQLEISRGQRNAFIEDDAVLTAYAFALRKALRSIDYKQI